MNLNAQLIKRHSEKTGRDYFCLEIQLTPNYKKIVFLSDLEVEAINLSKTTK